MRKLSFYIAILLIFVITQVNAQQVPWIDFNQNGQMDLYENPGAVIDNRVNDLLSRMTAYEKMQLLHEVAPAIPRLGIRKYDHGNEALHGVVRPGKFTVFPQAIGLAATWNPDLIFDVATVISDEARARWNELGQGELQQAKYSDLLSFWSPTVNMARDPRWGRTPETYGEDPYLASRIGVSFVKGLQGDDPRYLKVVSTPKHFAGNNEEHNRFSCKAVMSERALRSYYLPAFKALITEGKAQSVMTAYNAINGVPCTANKWLLTDILRNEWGFNGYIVSDCGAPGLLYSHHHYAPTLEDAAAMAMKAGLDLECSGYCNECFIYRDYLPRAYQMGKVTGTEINSAAFRVLRSRFKLGLFDDPILNPYTKIPPYVVGCSQHQQLALETARQSIVLLKNEGNILPLDLKKIKTIAVLGINANSCEFGDYSGTSVNKPVSPCQGIAERVGNQAEVKTMIWETPVMDKTNLFAKEKKLARSCDVVIAVMGINRSVEREGLDRESLDLPSDQMDFIRKIYQANPKTIVVLVAGSSMTINWIQDHIPGIINAWYPGEQGGKAIAEVLFGDYNPAGRLPLTWYNSISDLPAFDDYEVFNGRTYLYANKKPLYPFGFGLSYTTFNYSDIRIDKSSVHPGDTVKVSVDVRNTGKYNGDEVVQLYLHHTNTSEQMPVKQLKAFKRISLKTGKKQTVTFLLSREEMSFWNNKNEFILEPGAYNLMIGASSEDIRQQVIFEVPE
ncbi:MAG: glycoside hydrolase family 3 C-terminal domain-containing protein [Mangrovibacterium sp.]